MKNYVIIDYRDRTRGKIQPDIVSALKRFKPKGCTFKEYTMFDLLTDWVQMYSWLLNRNREYSSTEFVNTIRKSRKIMIYVPEMLELLAGN